MTEPDALFDVTPVTGVSRETSSPAASKGARRTARQRAYAERGVNPLRALIPTLQAHPDATPVTGPDDKTPGPRCGTCTFREVLGHRSRRYPKCLYGDGVHATHSEASDVRAWWPACAQYEARPEGTPT